MKKYNIGNKSHDKVHNGCHTSIYNGLHSGIIAEIRGKGGPRAYWQVSENIHDTIVDELQREIKDKVWLWIQENT